MLQARSGRIYKAYIDVVCMLQARSGRIYKVALMFHACCRQDPGRICRVCIDVACMLQARSGRIYKACIDVVCIDVACMLQARSGRIYKVCINVACMLQTKSGRIYKVCIDVACMLQTKSGRIYKVCIDVACMLQARSDRLQCSSTPTCVPVWPTTRNCSCGTSSRGTCTDTSGRRCCPPTSRPVIWQSPRAPPPVSTTCSAPQPNSRLFAVSIRGFQKLIPRKPMNFFLSNQLIGFSQPNQSIHWIIAINALRKKHFNVYGKTPIRQN